MPRWRRCSRSGRGGCGRRRKRGRSAMAASRVVARATGISRSTIQRGLRELDGGAPLAAGPDAPARGRAASGRPTSTRRCCATGRAGRADGARRSGLAAALDLPERAHVGGGAGGAGPPRQPHGGRRVAARPGLQPAGQRQDAGGPAASRSGRAVSLHRRDGCSARSGAAADDLGGHEEEGTGRRLQEGGPHVAARQGAPDACASTTS